MSLSAVGAFKIANTPFTVLTSIHRLKSVPASICMMQRLRILHVRCKRYRPGQKPHATGYQRFPCECCVGVAVVVTARTVRVLVFPPADGAQLQRNGMEMLPIALGDVVTLHELDISHNDLSVRPVVPCVVVRVFLSWWV